MARDELKYERGPADVAWMDQDERLSMTPAQLAVASADPEWALVMDQRFGPLKAVLPAPKTP